jgi:hypothetical protein
MNGKQFKKSRLKRIKERQKGLQRYCRDFIEKTLIPKLKV